jgi:hypothetical protein
MPPVSPNTPRLCFQSTILSTIDSWESGGWLNRRGPDLPEIDRGRHRIKRGCRRSPFGAHAEPTSVGIEAGAHGLRIGRGRRCRGLQGGQAPARDRTMAPRGASTCLLSGEARRTLGSPGRGVKPISSSAALSGSRRWEARSTAPRPRSRAPVWLQATPRPPPRAQALGRPAWWRPAQGPS